MPQNNSFCGESIFPRRESIGKKNWKDGLWPAEKTLNAKSQVLGSYLVCCRQPYGMLSR